MCLCVKLDMILKSKSLLFLFLGFVLLVNDLNLEFVEQFSFLIENTDLESEKIVSKTKSEITISRNQFPNIAFGNVKNVSNDLLTYSFSAKAFSYFLFHHLHIAHCNFRL